MNGAFPESVTSVYEKTLAIDQSIEFKCKQLKSTK